MKDTKAKQEKKQDDISLCRSCYCMTKTIDGKCGKCGDNKSCSEQVVIKPSDNKWTEVDERFDKEFTCVVTYEKWPDEEEQRLREPQYKFKDFPNTNPKMVKSFIHQELEEARRENENSIAWCPDCFDALEAIPIKENGMIKSWEYECFGCQKKFELASLTKLATKEEVKRI